MAASGAFAEGCQTRRRARRTRPESAVSCVLLTGRVDESREVPPVHRPRTSRGAPSRQALPYAATLRSAQIARSWLIPCRRPLRPQRFPIRPPSSAPKRSRVSASFTTAKTPPSRSAPGSARRRALEDALREIDAGAEGAVDQMAPALRAAARPRARAQRGRAAPGRRRAAEPPPGRRALGHADRAAGRRPERPGRRRADRRARARGRRRARARGRRRGAAPDEPDDGRRRARARAPTTTTTSDDEPEAAADDRRGRRRGRRATSPTRTDEDDDEPEDVWEDDAEPDVDEDVEEGAADDPNAHKRFWFEHATGAGKTVAAMGFVEASRTGGILILTHRRNLVDQFLGELHDRGYGDRESPAAARRRRDRPLRRPGHRRDLPVVRAQRRAHLRRLHDRHLRRGAHRAGREDLGRHPRLDRARSSSA